MVSDVVFSALLAYAGTLTIVLAGVLGWLVKKIWTIRSEDVVHIESRLSSLEQTLLGNPNDENDPGITGEFSSEFQALRERIDNLEEHIKKSERERKVEHREAIDAISGIAAALKKEGLNGDVPDPDDLGDD